MGDVTNTCARAGTTGLLGNPEIRPIITPRMILAILGTFSLHWWSRYLRKDSRQLKQHWLILSVAWCRVKGSLHSTVFLDNFGFQSR